MHIEGTWNAHSSCISVAFFLMHLQCTLEVQNSSQIEMIADIGTKALDPKLFAYLRDKLCGYGKAEG
jgi:hypothetical protein